ncbi:protein hunchback-like isoform X1 [Argopecten irradians]|uniref:protein hunchback-like isoform X1 n=2 Tax=Argopecten irradians TaxID=31199 RepID=UPI00371638F9
MNGITEWRYVILVEDDTPNGHCDPPTDSGHSQELFCEVKGREKMQGDEPDYNGAEDCSESIHDLGGAIKRADAVSPQIADGVDKVMSEDHTLIENQEDWKKSYEEHVNEDDHLNNSSYHGDEIQDKDNHLDNTSYHRDDLEDSSSPVVSPYDDSPNPNSTSYISDNSSFDTDSINLVPNKEGVYFCHLCSFSGRNQGEFEQHMTCHFEHTCPHCDYKSRTEGRLKRHIKDFHTEDPPEGFGSKRNMGRPKVFRCKQCDFSAVEKEEFWAHARSHIKEDKILQCPRCPFVTEYKHHLEYHLRNHFGSKPFKCNKCNYSCVNKSMLNSHMKSHTNVYQYRCADCTYATKYCHSLKLHLRKYNHKPATVLNSDGSLPQGIDAEASGLSLMQKRGPPRGPRGPRKDKFDPFVNQFLTMPHVGLPGMPSGINSGMMSPYWPVLNQFPPNGLHAPPPLVPVSMNSPLGSLPQEFAQRNLPLSSTPSMGHSPGALKQSPNSLFKCKFCSFASDIKNDLLRHVMKVHASENRDLFSIIGVSPEAFLEDRFKHKFGSPGSKIHSEEGKYPGLNIKREPSPDSIKSTTPSWPEDYPMGASPTKARYLHSPNGNMGKMSYDSYKNGMKSPLKVSDPPAGEDIIRQMMDKFGSGMPATSPRVNRESAPLDLTKRRSPSMSPSLAEGYNHHPQDRHLLQDRHGMPVGAEMYDSNQQRKRPTEDMENVESQETYESEPPKKRSRKGKAFKLDTLCMKLQEKAGDSDVEDAYSGSDGYVENEAISAQQDGESEPYGTENSNGDNTEDKPEEKIHTDDFEDIHRNLAILNNGKCSKFPDEENKEEMERRESVKDDDVKDMEENGKQTDQMNLNIKKALEMAQTKLKETGRRREMEMSMHAWNESSKAHYFPRGLNGHSLPSTPDLQMLHGRFSADNAHMPLITSTPKSKSSGLIGPEVDKYECSYCEISFRNCVMYTMHMGYHGYRNPFKCNMCGLTCSDKVDFFLHIAREAHN